MKRLWNMIRKTFVVLIETALGIGQILTVMGLYIMRMGLSVFRIIYDRTDRIANKFEKIEA